MVCVPFQPSRRQLIPVSSPQPPRMPKRKKAAKAAPAGMAVSLPSVCGILADIQGRSNNRPAAKQLPGATKPSAPPGAPVAPSMPTSGAAASRPVPKPALGGGAARAPPPPPAPPIAPAAPARPAKQMYKALYAFTGQEGEVALVKGELVEVKEKDENGMSYFFGDFELTSRMVEGTQEWSRRMGTCQLVCPHVE